MSVLATSLLRAWFDGASGLLKPIVSAMPSAAIGSNTHPLNPLLAVKTALTMSLRKQFEGILPRTALPSPASLHGQLVCSSVAAGQLQQCHPSRFGSTVSVA